MGVKARTLEDFGAVSEQTVSEMAIGTAAASNADIAISVSGIAGPDGGSPDKPVGTVWFGFFVDGDITTDIQVFTGDRHLVRAKAIDFALDKMLQLIAK